MNPYIIIGGLLAFLGAAIGGYTYGDHHRGAIDQVMIDKERADAAKAAADFAAKSAAKDAANAELSRNLEAVHAQAIADAAASADDFAKRLRAATTAARNRCVSAAAANPSQPANVTAGGDDQSRAVAAGTRLRDIVLKLQADVKECVAWANQVGR